LRGLAGCCGGAEPTKGESGFSGFEDGQDGVDGARFELPLASRANLLLNEYVDINKRMKSMERRIGMLDLLDLSLRVEEFGTKLKGLRGEIEPQANKLAGEQLNLELNPKAEELMSNEMPKAEELETKPLKTKYTVTGRLKERGLEKIANGAGRIGARARALYVIEAGKRAGEQERVYVKCAKFATYVYVGEELRFVDLAIDERLMKLGLYGDLMSSSLVRA
jgi:hypothetical protein